MSRSYGTRDEDEERAACLRPRAIVPPAPPSRDRADGSSSKRRTIVGASIALLGASAIATCAFVSSNSGVRELKAAPISMEARSVAASLVVQASNDQGATFESLDLNGDGVVTKAEYVSRLGKRRDDVLAKLTASNLAEDVKAPVAAIITDNFNSEAACVTDIFTKSGDDGVDRETFDFVHPLILSICKKNEGVEAAMTPSTTGATTTGHEPDESARSGPSTGSSTSEETSMSGSSSEADSAADDSTAAANADEDTEQPSPVAEENSTAGESAAADSPSTEASSKADGDSQSANTDEDTETVSPGSFSTGSSPTSNTKTEGSSESGPSNSNVDSSSTGAGPASSANGEAETNTTPSAAEGSSQGELSNAEDKPSPSASSGTASASNESDSPTSPPVAPSTSSHGETPAPVLVSDIKGALADLNMTLPGEGSQGMMQIQKFLEELTSSGSENATQSFRANKSPERVAFEEALTKQFAAEIAEHSQRLAYAKLQIKKNAFMLELMQECVTQAGRRFEMDASFSQEKAVSWIKDVCLVFPSPLRHEHHA